jgi:hypothetical protein
MAKLICFALIVLFGVVVSAARVPVKRQAPSLPDAGGLPDTGSGSAPGVPSVPGADSLALLEVIKKLLAILGLGTVPGVPGVPELPGAPGDVPKIPENLLALLLKVKIQLNLTCTDFCLCAPPNCMPNLNFDPTALPSLVQDFGKDFIASLEKGCLILATPFKQCLVDLQLCYQQCGANKQTCNSLLSVCLDLSVQVGLTCPDSHAVIEVVLRALLKVDLCALFLNKQQASCSNCRQLPGV